ncbi:MAG: HIT family protein [Rickettsiales bacterium]|jgi:diadenosine tetraphosphate (Ap4A) HIT family hydrolase|nr:HIT family protein [Rickettsiales bacterium]
MEEFTLDTRLKADTIEIADLNISKLLLMNDKNYPWFIIVPKKANAVEIFDLDDLSQKLLFQEISKVSEYLKRFYRADKVNIGALGNQVSQLHIHVIMRYKTDIAWPNPVWGYTLAIKYSEEEIEGIRNDIAKLVADVDRGMKE